MAVGKLVPEDTVFFLCDVQTRFRSLIHGFEDVVATANKMLKVAKALNIPVLVTVQNPKALGYTAPEIALDSLGPLLIGKLEKTLFSMVTPETKAILSDHSNVKSVVLFGIETQVCVLQTALDLLELNYHVHVIADGVSSCNVEEISIALDRIRQAGGHITTSESVAFQLQRDASMTTFKPFSSIIKEEKEATKKSLVTLCGRRSVL
ncbi:hypothetical protein PILCRDRAFT_818906 [Piloderma croceum F 1598]|uniref:Isochorismatase-like domain-containing protein n=1 Tax=Piloderma croceum (strain F 1598) TaxID=765440 RepID=A0A0C3FHL4_PILCF|nr:hypothetical protein PILCRDRAFT_818906 [Piloderma croceum F 1598]